MRRGKRFKYRQIVYVSHPRVVVAGTLIQYAPRERTDLVCGGLRWRNAVDLWNLGLFLSRLGDEAPHRTFLRCKGRAGKRYLELQARTQGRCHSEARRVGDLTAEESVVIHDLHVVIFERPVNLRTYCLDNCPPEVPACVPCDPGDQKKKFKSTVFGETPFEAVSLGKAGAAGKRQA